MPLQTSIQLPAVDYDLDATLDSGQAFRWVRTPEGWEGVVGRRWVRLRQEGATIHALTVDHVADWDWLTHYLQSDVDLAPIVASFPNDEPMRRSLQACRGLRLLRQDPWECLASFVLSSSKQIVQIRQIVRTICDRFGTPLQVPLDSPPLCAFPSPLAIAQCTEVELRACKMGFRAPNLLATARKLAANEIDLNALAELPMSLARQELMRCPGVGRKIADCVLLFAFGFPAAFPVDVWVEKTLQKLYFPRRRAHRKRLEQFVAGHFGPHAGYAQQYLFHYARVRGGLTGLPI